MSTTPVSGLDATLVASWHRRGWVRVDGLLPAPTVACLPAWVDAVSLPAREPGMRRLHYHEEVDGRDLLCRTERYLDDHPGLRALITSGPLLLAASQLLGEPALVYKEKINHKYPGGAGFAPHQDATAYRHVSHHVTCLVAVDAMTSENGCLEFARGRFAQLLPDDGDGCLLPAVAAALRWEPVRLDPGSVLFFSSLVPHRSGANRSARSRRALYLTYNAASQGDWRETYYAERDAVIERAAPGARAARVSNIGHFRGRPARGGSQT